MKVLSDEKPHHQRSPAYALIILCNLLLLEITTNIDIMILAPGKSAES
mgnify:CR=1 FL=1